MRDFYCPVCLQHYPDNFRVPHGAYSVCQDCDENENFRDCPEDFIFIKKRKKRKISDSERFADYLAETYD